jgi:hypothetical protein
MSFITTCKSPDATSIDVLLSSVGKLTAPAKIKVKDMDVKSAVRMSLADDTHHVSSLLTVLQDIIQEPDFDVGKLHENEMEEILVNLYARYWSAIMTLPYFPSDKEIATLVDTKNKLYEEFLKGDFSPTVEVDLTSLDNIVLSDTFAEPFFVEAEGVKYGFRLPRMEDYYEAELVLDKKYAMKARSFQPLENLMQHNRSTKNDPEQFKSYDPSELKRYEAFSIDKMTDYLSIKQQCTLVSVDGRALSNLEEKLAIYVPSSVWEFVKQQVILKYPFGVARDLTIKSPFTGEALSWRAPFQYLDFISSRQLRDTSRFTVQFGTKSSV